MRVLNDVSGPLFAARNYVLAESETYMYLLFILLPRITGKKKNPVCTQEAPIVKIWVGICV